MESDFITALLCFLFDQDKKVNPMPAHREAQFFRYIKTLLKRHSPSDNTEKKGE